MASQQSDRQISWAGTIAPGNPGVVAGVPPSLPPYNAQEVRVHDSSPLSATVDVTTGILDTGRLTQVRDRAIYDTNELVWSPAADAGTGVLCPNAVEAKTVVESALRSRPTTFRGPKQLDVSTENPDEHWNRMIHPLAWRTSTRADVQVPENMVVSGKPMDGSGAGTGMFSIMAGSSGAGSGTGAGSMMPPSGDWLKDATSTEGRWYNFKENLPFVGYPNPNLFNMYTDAIPTQNLQNISYAQLTDAMRASSDGGFNYSNYLNAVGTLLKSDAAPAGNISQSADKIVQIDNGGVNADPRILERIYTEYEADFNIAKRLRVAEQSADPRFAEPTPGDTYIAEKNKFLVEQEDFFTKLQDLSGVASGFTQSRVLLT
jgi:hypothetical protein